MFSTGLQTLIEEQAQLVAGRKIGLLCHAASVDHKLRHAGEVVVLAGGRIACLLGPEHGVCGDAQDMVSVGEGSDRTLQVPVYTLYGETEESLRPRRQWLQGLDAVVVDLQDVGSRYYTYVWTMGLTMQVAAEVGVQVVILDRPNPLGGERLEGPGIDPDYRSFVGLHSLPVRHGLTTAELARLLVSEWGLELDLQLVRLRGWSRELYFDGLPQPWVMPSPNMPALSTAVVYGGGCLLEATNVSEGRGTTRPFEIVGAPWVNGQALARALEDEDLPGVGFRPLTFRPTFHKYQGECCGGVQLHVHERQQFRPLLTGVALLRCLKQLWPEHFAWRTEPYEFVSDRPAIDLLAGGTWLRDGLEVGEPTRDLSSGWADHERRFRQRRQPYLIY